MLVRAIFGRRRLAHVAVVVVSTIIATAGIGVAVGAVEGADGRHGRLAPAQEAGVVLGPIPAPGDIGLLVVQKSMSPEDLSNELASRGCLVSTLAKLELGLWDIWIRNAPAIVNRAFAPILDAMTPFVVRCEGEEVTVGGGPATASGIAPGPLSVDPANPRYFTDGSGQAVLLTGSHTWRTLHDWGEGYPPPAFDYPFYLDVLETRGHNFIRLWAWEQSRWMAFSASEDLWVGSSVYQRTGPGTANDGLPRFDVTRFDQAFFDRLRSRVIEAGQRGIYVSVMLFDGWSVAQANQGNPWRGHPFNAGNNINGIAGDVNGDGQGGETHTLAMPAITALHRAYVRKVIDTVNDLDNVLYEISNESPPGSHQWQYAMIEYIKDYEATKSQQHPVGMTVEFPGGSNQLLFESPADWISLNGDINNPPVADGRKVILSDTDHLCGVCGDRRWVWKSFLRGENPIYMDPWRGGRAFANETDAGVRDNLGYVQAYAARIDLGRSAPCGNRVSTGYCLGRTTGADAELLAYLPDGGEITVDLRAASGSLIVEWFNPATGATRSAGTTLGGDAPTFESPFEGDAVLFLHR